MLRRVMIALVAGGLLTAGAISVAASESHGDAVSAAARAAGVKGEARGDVVSLIAGAQGQAMRADAKADRGARSGGASKDTDTDTTTASTTDKDAHGDMVSAAAKSDCTAAQDSGKKNVNHGACVSQVASQSR
jgi:hypothetical protein